MTIRKRHRTFLFLAVSCLLLAGFQSAAQQPAAPSASLQGVVLEAGSTNPVPKATVQIGNAGGTSAEVTRTDSEGKFYIPKIAPGQYRIVVSHTGHVNAKYESLTLAPGQRVDSIRIEMTRGGSISGHITDKGRPAGLSDAAVFRAVYTEGQLTFDPVMANRTDDLGEYHLFWLPPGRYYLAAVIWETASAVGWITNSEGIDTQFYSQRQTSRAVFMRTTAGGVSDSEAHVPVFYPGTPDVQLAAVIDVLPGADLRGMDIEAGPQPTRRITGTVAGIPAAAPPTPIQAGQAGPPGNRVSVNMRPLTGTYISNQAQVPNATVDPSGTFEITKVVPGRYVLNASAGNLSGRIEVEIRDRDLTNITVVLSPGFTVTGRLTVERAATAPATPLTGLRIGLRTDPLSPGGTTYGTPVQADGSFAFPLSGPPNGPNAGPANIFGPLAGDYRVLVNPILTPPTDSGSVGIPAQFQSWYVKSIRMGDVDLLNDTLHLASQPSDPMLIVIGTNPGSVRGKATPGSTVVLIHDNALRYRVNEKTSVADAAGNFVFENVAPGNYKAFAWETVERGLWQDPNFMRTQEERGVPVHVDEGKPATIDLKLN